MQRTLSGLLIFAVAGWLAYHTVVFLTPYAVLLKLKLASHSQFNQPVYADVITDKDRHVVLPNPDFLYVVSGYNIRKAPVRITGRLPEGTYSSIAFYSSNTRNFYVQNDRQTTDKEISILLVKEGDEKKFAGKGGEVVAAPSALGTVMVRMLIDDTGRIGYLKEVQRTFRIHPVE